MQKKIIRKLNQLNNKFYQSVADDFSESRQYFWQGWEKITKYLEKNSKNQKKIIVLDIACGNARFAQFLKEKKMDFTYFGLDNSQHLLKIADKTIKKENITGQIINFDLIASYLKNSKIIWPFSQSFDIIVAFGLTHHLPSDDLRFYFFQSLKKLLTKDGLVIVSNWQFAKDERFQKNILNWQKINEHRKINLFQKIQLKNLLTTFEKNDYLLDWRKKEKSKTKQELIRYCYYLDEKESLDLINQSGFLLVDRFFADGKSQKLNLYFVLKKAN